MIMRHMSLIPEKEWIPDGLIATSFRRILGGVTEFRQQIVAAHASTQDRMTVNSINLKSNYVNDGCTFSALDG